MGVELRFGADGFEVHVTVEWQRLWMFCRNLLFLVWSIFSLLAALKASGVNLPLPNWLGGV